MKRKAFCRVLCAVLVLLLAVSAFVACNDKNKNNNNNSDNADVYTITFKDGDVEIANVEVKKGEAIAQEQIPAAPTGHDGEVFLGWFVGSVRVDASYIPDGSTVAVAQFGNEPEDPDAPKYFVSVNKSSEFSVSGLLETGYIENAVVTFEINVLARGKHVDSVQSADVTATMNVDGTYSFTMPAKNVSLNITLAENVSVPESAEIELFMLGDLYDQGCLNARAIYAKVPQDLSGNFLWKSSDPSTVLVDNGTDSVQQGKMPEALLLGQKPGTATISCIYALDMTLKESLR